MHRDARGGEGELPNCDVVHVGGFSKRPAHTSGVSGSYPTKPLKIAVVSSLVTRLQPAQLGGAQAFLSDLATGLSQRGHEVLLYCAEGSVLPGVDLVYIPVPPAMAHSSLIPASRNKPTPS